ncbi:RNA-binding S4 domain-containing protein [Amycolatopsis sp. H20-H5]|uniref:RNA-binding S4 domain-containing protein n=1 Tax=Amycolatopsis sp. H20-H5 TaxID=3046309 RepID=UPI002DB95448|nr:RNA-binding S4 domain-containing protein [Amycolatopsis sp. H20-H5]MEC3975723.1 RNA-binding S4 domain-containing protein [Amycolatopsis sp. H20-H5]
MNDDSVRDVPITGEPIRLGQFLKLAGLAENGSHVKDLIDADEVTVNDELETRRGRQLKHGDIVAVGSMRGRVVLT